MHHMSNTLIWMCMQMHLFVRVQGVLFGLGLIFERTDSRQKQTILNERKSKSEITQ